MLKKAESSIFRKLDRVCVNNSYLLSMSKSQHAQRNTGILNGLATRFHGIKRQKKTLMSGSGLPVSQNADAFAARTSQISPE